MGAVLFNSCCLQLKKIGRDVTFKWLDAVLRADGLNTALPDVLPLYVHHWCGFATVCAQASAKVCMMNGKPSGLCVRVIIKIPARNVAE